MHTTSLIVAMIQAGNIAEAKDLAEKTGKNYDEIAANLSQRETGTDPDESVETESTDSSVEEEVTEEDSEAEEAGERESDQG